MLEEKKKIKRKKYKANVYHRPRSPHWWGQVIINGIRYFNKFDGRLNKEEASKLCDKWKQEQKELKSCITNGGYKSWDFCKKNFLEYSEKEVKARTFIKYKNCFSIIEKILNPRGMENITRPVIINLQDKLKNHADEKGEDYHGVNKIISTLKVLLGFCMKRGWMPDYFLGNVTELKCKKLLKVEIYNQEEIKLLLKYSPLHWRLIILLCYDSGHRPEEAINQLIQNIDTEKKLGLITKNEKDEKKGIKEWTPKIGKTRLFGFSDNFVNELKKVKHKSPYIVANEKGRPLRDMAYSVLFNKHLQKVNKMIESVEPAGTPKISGTLKMLRKTFVTTYQANGAKLEDVSKSVGHSNVNITLKHYTKNDFELFRKNEEERLKRLDVFRQELSYEIFEE